MDRATINNAAFEYRRIQLAEEGSVQPFDGFCQVRFRHHDAQVQQRGALRDHAHIDVAQRMEDSGGHSRSIADILAYQAYDRVVLFDVDLRELAQFGADGVQVARVVDGQRDADFRG